MTREDYLNSLIGKPWKANAKGPDEFDCWHLCANVRLVLFSHHLPDVPVPQNPSWKWLVGAFEAHPERKNWQLVEPNAAGFVDAADGSIVLMARSDRPAHAGIWLMPENRVLHADQ